MKEAYQNAEMDLVRFSAADVISTSDAIKITVSTKEDELPGDLGAWG